MSIARIRSGISSDASLEKWAKRIAAWHAGAQLQAPFDAASISKKLGLPEREPVIDYRRRKARKSSN